jgi:long-chain acyl-CoA synthetase
MRSTINSFIDQCLARGDETAFANRRGVRIERWTYAELAHTAIKFSRELAHRNIGKGDRVLLWAANGPEWVAAFFGCALQGAVVVPLDEQSAPDFVGRVQQQVEAKLLLCDGKHALRFSDRLPILRLEDIRAISSPHPLQPVEEQMTGDDDLVEIIFTSGTTAEPKGVCLTHRNLLANLNPLEMEIDKYLFLERPFHPVRFLCLLPLSHVFGQFMGIFVPMLLGGEVHFLSSQNPSEIIGTVKRERISVIAAVPRQLETLRDKIERDQVLRERLDEFRSRFAKAEGRHYLKRWWMFRDVHHRFGWKFWAFVTGGATLDEETEKFWQRMAFAVVQGYGMTETASLITVNHPFKLSRGSIGKAMPGREMKIDETGEIMVRGENVSAGYWRRGAQSLTGDEGWLRTGDIAEADAGGNLFFKGRKKDVIVTAAGLNIYPDDLEAALNDQPEVIDSCVIGVEGHSGPEPQAVLILRDEQADAAEIVKRANATLGSAQRIRRWMVWPEPDFPRTPTQKVRKPAVKEAVLAANMGAKRNGIKSGILAEIVSSIAGDTSAITGQPDRSADDLKLDSLGRVELISAIEDRYQIELDETAITASTTMSDLERLVRQGASGESPMAAAEYPYPRWTLRWPVTWLRFISYYLLVAPFVFVMSRPRVRGSEHLRELRKPVLFIANHISMVDPAIIMYALPLRFRQNLAIAMAGERLRGLRRGLEGANRFGRAIDRLKYFLVTAVFNVFSLPQKSGFRRSFYYAGEAADRGYHVLVFPEGRTTDDGSIKPFMPGVGLLAKNLDVPVVPLKIEGLFDLTRERRYFSRPGTVEVRFGKPISFAKDIDPSKATEVMEMVIRKL